MEMDDMCEDHHEKFRGKVHKDRKHNPGMGYAPDHKRGVMHPQMHSRGKMPAQINPDHGPHK